MNSVRISPTHPGTAIPDHQPLGGIQRCRKRVYEESQKLRHSLNKAEDREPTSDDLACLGPVLDKAAA